MFLYHSVIVPSLSCQLSSDECFHLGYELTSKKRGKSSQTAVPEFARRPYLSLRRFPYIGPDCPRIGSEIGLANRELKVGIESFRFVRLFSSSRAGDRTTLLEFRDKDVCDGYSKSSNVLPRLCLPPRQERDRRRRA